MRWMRLAVVAVMLNAFASTPGVATSDVPSDDDAIAASPEVLVPVPVAGPFAYPWSIGFLPDDIILITEKPGRLSLVRPHEVPEPIRGLPKVLSGDHGGLLDVAVDPDFVTSRTLYLSYTHGTEARATLRVLKARLDLEQRALVDQEVIFESDPPASGLEQLGGRMAFTPEGYLLLSLGDRWGLNRAQDLSDHAGSIIRIRSDGLVPDDNPLMAVPGAKPEIWTYGHRNPQGLAVDHETGRVWSVEHGPQGGDELNLIEGGNNYGWPIVSHGSNYDGSPVGIGQMSAPGLKDPVYVWVPSIAPSGLALRHEGGRLALWVGALAGQMLVRLDLDQDRVTHAQSFLQGELGRIRDVRLGPDGFLYTITDDAEGWLYRLVPETEQALRAHSPL